MKGPLISIVTPTLNRAALLEKNLKSTLEQNYPYIEHIVVDGKSNDGTVELLKSYEPKYRSFGGVLRWVSEKDKNHTAAMNKGFKMATGDYVAFMYSDEYWAPNAMQAVVSEAQKSSPADIVYGNSLQYYPDKSDVVLITYGHYTLEDMIFRGQQIPIAGAIFRRNLFNKVGFLNEDLEYVAEYDFLVRCLKAGAKTEYINSPVAYMFEHPQRKVLLDIAASWKETKKVNFSYGAHYFTPFYAKYFANVYLRGILQIMKGKFPELFRLLKKAIGQ